MSLLSDFVTDHVLKSMEEKLVEHAPEVQAAILKELADFAMVAVHWAEDKLASHIEG